MEINELRKAFTCRAPSSPEEQKRLYAYLRLNGVEPGEIYQGVEMSSAYVNTHHDTSYSNAMMNLHSHLFYEIICCTNTCDVEYLVGTERYRLQKGDIIFVAPGVSHKAILPERMPVPYERDVLWLSEKYAELMKEMKCSRLGSKTSEWAPICSELPGHGGRPFRSCSAGAFWSLRRGRLARNWPLRETR